MLREAQIDSLANFLVSGLVAKGVIKPKGDIKDLVVCVVELMSANFEMEAKIDEEADRMAEELARKDPRARSRAGCGPSCGRSSPRKGTCFVNGKTFFTPAASVQNDGLGQSA